MKLYLVRHGEVPHNVLRIFAESDDDLTELGINQAEELREKIKDIEYDLIICSPLLRTTHTANIINVNNSKIVYDNRLEERKCGNLSGKSFNKEERKEYWNYNSNNMYGTEEEIKKFFERVYDFIDDLKNEDYKNVLIVSHSGVTKAFSGYFEGINDGYFLKRGLKNCEIKEYVL